MLSGGPQDTEIRQPTYVTRAWCIFESYAAALEFDHFLIFSAPESRGRTWVLGQTWRTQTCLPEHGIC